MKRASSLITDGHVCLFGKQFHSAQKEPLKCTCPSFNNSPRNISNGNNLKYGKLLFVIVKTWKK